MARLDARTLLSAYMEGVFPMADANGEIRYYAADPRGILPLESFHVPQTLARLVRKQPPVFDIRINFDFRETMRGCMTGHGGTSWIVPKLIDAYCDLHEMGFAHSVEAWFDGKLAGGLYGVSLGGAFFGESMFTRVRDASKVCLVTLVNRLKERGYKLLDTQATTTHLIRFGAINIPATEYESRLREALAVKCTFI